jgi:hypothetical protein
MTRDQAVMTLVFGEVKPAHLIDSCHLTRTLLDKLEAAPVI